MTIYSHVGLYDRIQMCVNSSCEEKMVRVCMTHGAAHHVFRVDQELRVEEGESCFSRHPLARKVSPPLEVNGDDYRALMISEHTWLVAD